MPELIPSQNHFTSKVAFSIFHGDQMTSCELGLERVSVAPFPYDPSGPARWAMLRAGPTLLHVLLSPASLAESDVKKAYASGVCCCPILGLSSTHRELHCLQICSPCHH